MYATRTYFFQLIGSCSNKTEKGTFFLSILLSLKTIGKGVKFQDITPIRATFTNTIANGIINRVRIKRGYGRTDEWRADRRTDGRIS